MELARSIVSRLRQYVGDRRHARRHTVRLPFTLSVASQAKGLNGTKLVSSLRGHTLDLSPTGLALIVSAIRISEHHLMGENRSLDLKLELPDGQIEMQVAPVRYETLDEHPSETGYLIGVKITEIHDEDRATLAVYISTLTER